MPTTGIGRTSNVLFLLGIVLLAIGFIAVFYHTSFFLIYDMHGAGVKIDEYPYQNVGLALVLTGLVFLALGFLYPTRKQEPVKETSLL
jgi:LPXTG-motif cell wall-anchored protein